MSNNVTTGIEVIREDMPRSHFKYALFDFDGTISTIREGWQDIMVPVMLSAICGDNAPPPEIEERIREFIDDTTGIQTILQMAGLVDLVKEYGYVPEDEILDDQGYKAIYNEALLVPVQERLRMIESGEKSVDDFTVRGSIDFLKRLRALDLTLYLASGTDIEYVRNEAEVVGAAQYFNGGIYGALKTFEEYSKDQVIKDLLREKGLPGSELIVFGDGPVEIRNAKENGAVAVGVASDEKKGEGLDLQKRERLIAAGADVIIADFKHSDELLDVMGMNRSS